MEKDGTNLKFSLDFQDSRYGFDILRRRECLFAFQFKAENQLASALL
jgi:hypothetical protein